MNKQDLKYCVYADIYRAYGRYKIKTIIRILLGVDASGAKIILYTRILRYLSDNNKLKIGRWILEYRLTKLKIKYGIQVNYKTNIGAGVTMPHCGGIVIGTGTSIGKNCTILQGVTIGSNLFKDRFKLATIGDNVLIGAGAKIIGPINIGDDVTIGANSVVTKDLPSGVVVGGNPARILVYKKSIVIYEDYDIKYNSK